MCGHSEYHLLRRAPSPQVQESFLPSTLEAQL
jgi:hypothetical protein